MAYDSLDIDGSVRFDGPKLFRNDPFFVEVTVTNGSGGVVDNASVVAAAQHPDFADETVQGVTGADGTVILSLQIGKEGVWEVFVKAETNTQRSTTSVQELIVREDPTVKINTGSRLLYSKNTITAGTH